MVGVVAGSVANALIYRLPRGISWWKGRSMCPECKHALAWYDLIPLLSYLFLKGKCRYCRKPIAIRYFLVELVMGIAFAVSGLSFLSCLVWVTVVIAVMDWEMGLVSEWMVVLWGLLVLWKGSWVGLGVGVIIIGGIWAVSRRRAMGFGDVEIAAVMGWWLGWPKIVVGLWVAFVGGAIVGVITKRKLHGVIAFGPFLILGTWIAYLWGDKIWRCFLY